MAGTFLTEVGIVDEFAPPANSGVKLRVPAFGEKTLIFPEVKPKTYRPGNDAAIFGYPRFGGGNGSGKKVSQYSFRHLRSRNLLAHNPMHDEEMWHQNQHHLAPPDMNSARRRHKKELSHRVAPLEDGRQADEASAASGVTSMTPTTMVSSSRHTAVESLASGSSFTHTSMASSANSVRTPVPSCVASSRLSRGSAYENLVSVSQVGLGSATSRSIRSSQATTEIARLAGELAVERANRETTQKRLHQLQERQELLLQRLRAAGMDDGDA